MNAGGSFRRAAVRALALFAALAPGGTLQAQVTTVSLLPGSGDVKGWALTEPPKTYSGSRLFDYMDGAGEIPRSYGFQELASGKYKQGQTSIEAAVFDMGSSADAFGYYSARSFLENNPGASQRVIMLDHSAHLYAAVGVLTFWKDRYTVIIQPETGKPAESALLQFARVISARIKTKGAPPALLGLLPAANRLPNTERYVKGKAAFDSLLVFTPRDAFGAANGAVAVGAEYRLGGGSPTLFIVRYRSGQAAPALNAYRTFLTSRKALFSPTKIMNGFAAMAKREKGTAAAVVGDSLAGVVGATDARSAQTCLNLLLTVLRAK